MILRLVRLVESFFSTILFGESHPPPATRHPMATVSIGIGVAISASATSQLIALFTGEVHKHTVMEVQADSLIMEENDGIR